MTPKTSTPARCRRVAAAAAAASLTLLAVLAAGCFSPEPEGLAAAPAAATTVKIDLFHRPLPEIPLPNDLATRYDPTSATGLRVNASMVAPTQVERRIRRLIDGLDGWGMFQSITIPFSGPLDVESILKAHRDKNYDLSDDVIYLINIDRRSPDFGKAHHLDLGNGNYPVVLESLDKYWKNDPRGWTLSMLFEEEDEDKNGNGKLDPGEDTNADGVLNKPNYLPGKNPARTDLAGRADALMYFYERETHTVIARPLEPLRERTTYAVIVTRRLKDVHGQPVGSPYPFINHVSQNVALRPLLEVLPPGLTARDIAFAWSYTTQSAQAHVQAVRDGLYGFGVQGHLGKDFPGELAGLEKLKDLTVFGGQRQNPHVLYGEELAAIAKPLMGFLNFKDGSRAAEVFSDSLRYVDYFVVGSYRSPQLFPRTRTTAVAGAAAGNEGGACLTDGTCQAGLTCWSKMCVKLLPLDEQSWPADLDRRAAPARDETVYFTISVPRREVSVRGQGKPAPLVILGHGYTSSRTEVLSFGGLLARAGFATIGIDCVSHGLGVGAKELALIRAALAGKGLDGMIDAIVTKNRAFDQNNDGTTDSGADFWTAHAFHTRDMVRQSALDYMQLVRILRGFDGQRRGLDVNGDGKPELAGDFDGDGVVDVGGPATPIYMTGGSLGGILSLYTGALEPGIKAITPIAGGAGLPDVGIRSRQGGVPEAFYLRVMGPLTVATRDAKTGDTLVESIVPDLNRSPALYLATVKGVQLGDTMLVENLLNGERGCSYVSPEGLARAAVASDLDDKTQITFYAGDALDGEDCKLKTSAVPRVQVASFEKELVFQGRIYRAGDTLTALADGLGLRRTSSKLRGFVTFAQMIIDPGDPAPYMRHLSREPLVYPATGQQTGAHAIIISTIGDMNVPLSTGVSAGRAAGLIDYLHDDPRYGKPENQVLLDTHTVEAVNTLRRYTDPTGKITDGIHLDVDNLSSGTDLWGASVPRLDPPLRIGWTKKDRLGGISAALFPMSDPTGTHGFDMPGQMTDRVRGECKSACQEKGVPDPCGCSKAPAWDIGLFMFNMMGRYFRSGATILDADPCHAHDDCADRQLAPAVRDPATLK